MDEPILLGTVETLDDGTVRLLAPAVGWWSGLPHEGALLGPGSSIGRLRRLNRDYRLVVPAGAAGQVSGPLPRERVLAVEYGQELLRLRSGVEERFLVGAEDPAVADAPNEGRAIVAPTDGVFYRSPAPGTPPFVEPGQTIQLGQPVGLVEVMKTFNQIVYEGPGFADRAEVVEVPAKDGSDVRAGQVLVVVR